MMPVWKDVQERWNHNCHTDSNRDVAASGQSKLARKENVKPASLKKHASPVKYPLCLSLFCCHCRGVQCVL